MEPIIDSEYILKTFAFMTMVGQAYVAVWFLGFIAKKIQKRDNWITRSITRKGLGVAFVVALVATIGSLSFSEIALLTPCKLCWFQRILMYPLVFTLGTAFFSKKDSSNIITATLIMASLGAVIALYHYLEQFGFAPIDIPCSAVGYSVACANKFEATYGYITIPLMSLTSFVMILISLGMRKKI